MTTQTLTIINDESDRKVPYVCRWDFNWDSVFKTADVVDQLDQLDQLDQENELLFMIKLSLF